MDNLINSFNSNILSYITYNKDTKFILFFPPYSIYAYKLWSNNNLLEVVHKFKEHIYLTTSTLGNCEPYDFQLSHDIKCNLNNYKDYSHYHQKINSVIIQHILDKRFKVENKNYT